MTWTHWIAVAAALLVGLPLALAAVGLLLADGHVATRSAVYRGATPEALFALLVDRAAYPSWRPEVKRIEPLADVDGKPSFREHGKQGAITFVVDEQRAEPPARLVTRIDDEKLPFGGRWIYELEPAAGGGTRLTITEEGFVKNPIFRTLSRTVFSLSATLEQFHRAVARRLGEEGVTPEGTPVRHHRRGASGRRRPTR